MILWNPLSPFFLQLEAKKLYEYGKQKKYGKKMLDVGVVGVSQLEVVPTWIIRTRIISNFKAWNQTWNSKTY
jgi:hypothetical protein